MPNLPKGHRRREGRSWRRNQLYVKRANPEQRGQFNLGEKLVLAVCEQGALARLMGRLGGDIASR
jgi:hypothetical protein